MYCSLRCTRPAWEIIKLSRVNFSKLIKCNKCISGKGERDPFLLYLDFRVWRKYLYIHTVFFSQNPKWKYLRKTLRKRTQVTLRPLYRHISSFCLIVTLLVINQSTLGWQAFIFENIYFFLIIFIFFSFSHCWWTCFSNVTKWRTKRL